MWFHWIGCVRAAAYANGLCGQYRGFSSGPAAKAFLASIVMALAILQTVTAMGIYGRIPLRGAWVSPLHRWSGRLEFLISVPVAVHCLYALGFQNYDGRVIAHSIFGRFFYGASSSRC